MRIPRDEFVRRFTALFLKDAGRFLIQETVRRGEAKSDSILVGGTVAFYRRCGFYDYEHWVWAAKPGYAFHAPRIQP